MRQKSGWLYAVGVIFLLAWNLLPIGWSFQMSVTPESEMQTSPAPLMPENPTWQNYRSLMFDPTNKMGRRFRQAMLNSLLTSCGSILIILPVSTLSAYALTRLRFKGRMFIKNSLLLTLVIPVLATIVPLYTMFSKIGMLGSYTALILVYTTSFLPLNVWMISNYFITLPQSLEEAALVDGCSRFKTLLYIILPISLPAIFTSALIIFISVWNQYAIPLILAPQYSIKPLTVVVTEFATKESTNYGMINAGGIIAIILPIVMAVVFRRILMRGMVAGSTKG